MIDYVSTDVTYPKWFGHDFKHLRPAGYYFWDETGTVCYGPFNTRAKAAEEMDRYAESLET